MVFFDWEKILTDAQSFTPFYPIPPKVIFWSLYFDKFTSGIGELGLNNKQ